MIVNRNPRSSVRKVVRLGVTARSTQNHTSVIHAMRTTICIESTG